MYDFSNWSLERLEKRFNELSGLSVDILREQCAILVELARHRSVARYSSSGYFRFFREIASGALDAEAVILVGGSPALITALLGFSPERQRAIASGEAVKTVEHDERGKVSVAEKPIQRMTTREIGVAFCDTGVRPIAEQRRLLEKMPKDVRSSSVANEGRYDPETEEIVCGRMRIPMASIAEWAKGHWKITRAK